MHEKESFEQLDKLFFFLFSEDLGKMVEQVKLWQRMFNQVNFEPDRMRKRRSRGII